MTSSNFSLPSWSRPQWLLFLLIAVYSVGVLAMAFEVHPEFMRLTPLNLLFCVGLILAAPQRRHQTFILLSLGVYIATWTIEWFGVQTGILFGDYSYGRALGPKYLGTPFIIGLNWWMLLYGSNSMANRLPRATLLLRSAVAATCMLALDILLEPVAVKYDFWSWSSFEGYNALLVAPWQNYAAWWGIAFVLSIGWQYWLPKRHNTTAEAVYFAQAIFFISLLV